MQPNLSGFRQFLEDMDPSPDKKMGKDRHSDEGGENLDYFGGLGDEMKIPFKNVKSAMESEPWVSSHFGLGDIKYKLSAWEIVPGSMSSNGASIRLKPQKGDRSYLKGNKLNKGEPDQKIYHLNRKELEQFLTGGWAPAIQNAQGAAGGGAPGGAPPI